MHNTWEQYKDMIITTLMVVLLYAFMEFVLKITCPIKFATGISCPGCGMSRAWLSLLHLDLKTAFYYHPLFWLPPVMLIVFLKNKKIGPNYFLYTCITLVLIIYIIRMTGGKSTVVVFEPENGFVVRLIKKVCFDR